MIGKRIWYEERARLVESGIVVNEAQDENGYYYLVVFDDGSCTNVDGDYIKRTEEVSVEELLTHCDEGVRYIGEENLCY